MTDVLMPALSPTMEEGTLAKWHVKKGDVVKSGDVIAEIETDKATMEVEAVDEGVVEEILVPEGTEEVKVNAPIARLSGEGETAKPVDASHDPLPGVNSGSNGWPFRSLRPVCPVGAFKPASTAHCVPLSRLSTKRYWARKLASPMPEASPRATAEFTATPATCSCRPSRRSDRITWGSLTDSVRSLVTPWARLTAGLAIEASECTC